MTYRNCFNNIRMRIKGICAEVKEIEKSESDIYLYLVSILSHLTLVRCGRFRKDLDRMCDTAD